MSSSTAQPQHQIERYQHFLQQTQGLRFDSYDALWQWSVSELDAFWLSLWEFFELKSPTPFEHALCEERMPGARWFEGATINYAAQVLRHADAADAAGRPAIVHSNEAMLAKGELGEMSWPELQRQVGTLAAALRGLGVSRGDRVVAYMPNIPQTAVAFLAVASLGAIWSVCSPDMGPVAVLDRFRQIEPKALIGVDGYVYAGQSVTRMALLRELLDALPSVEHVLLLPQLEAAPDLQSLASPTRRAHDLAALLAQDLAPEQLVTPELLPFDHPLWIVYSSGTTGLPKPIVHSHGGIVLEGLKGAVLHNDLRAEDRFHWYSSTGWIMWNCQVGGLLAGSTICIFDGSPGGSRERADWGTLWRFAALSRASFFGAGAAFYASCLKAGVEPMAEGDLSALRAVGSTGSPLADECYDWIWAHCPRPGGKPIWIACISGGTDFAGAFLAGHPLLPVHRGQMQCRCLGAAVYAYSPPDAKGQGQPLVDEVGELVCTRPIPSMPLRFWNDPGDQRYLDSYFDMYRSPSGEGIWRHGDWLRITPEGGAIIYGRSDATINRHGIRMGTAELYRAVETQPEVLDSLVVDLEYLGRESYMPLFVVLREGHVLDEALSRRLRDAIKAALSPRHVPNEVLQVQAIPRTLSGKKMELPVKKLLLGAAPETVFKRDAMANADCVDWFVDFAQRRLAREQQAQQQQQ